MTFAKEIVIIKICNSEQSNNIKEEKKDRFLSHQNGSPCANIRLHYRSDMMPKDESQFQFLPTLKLSEHRGVCNKSSRQNQGRN